MKMHVRDRDLTIERIAREHGISERYAYLILARQGITLGDWIRTQRLEGAAQDLTRTDNPAPSISEIAHNWGFPDQGNFTRAFRRRYGQSPSEYRKVRHPAQQTDTSSATIYPFNASHTTSPVRGREIIGWFQASIDCTPMKSARRWTFRWTSNSRSNSMYRVLSMSQSY